MKVFNKKRHYSITNKRNKHIVALNTKQNFTNFTIRWSNIDFRLKFFTKYSSDKTSHCYRSDAISSIQIFHYIHTG